MPWLYYSRKRVLDIPASTLLQSTRGLLCAGFERSEYNFEASLWRHKDWATKPFIACRGPTVLRRRSVWVCLMIAGVGRVRRKPERRQPWDERWGSPRSDQCSDGVKYGKRAALWSVRACLYCVSVILSSLIFARGDHFWVCTDAIDKSTKYIYVMGSLFESGQAYFWWSSDERETFVFLCWRGNAAECLYWREQPLITAGMLFFLSFRQWVRREWIILTYWWRLSVQSWWEDYGWGKRDLWMRGVAAVLSIWLTRKSRLKMRRISFKRILTVKYTRKQSLRLAVQG